MEATDLSPPAQFRYTVARQHIACAVCYKERSFFPWKYNTGKQTVFTVNKLNLNYMLAYIIDKTREFPAVIGNSGKIAIFSRAKRNEPSVF